MNLIEKAADPADMASQLEEQYHEQRRLAREHSEAQRLLTYRRLVSEGKHDPAYCFKCGDELIPSRVADSRLRCTPCEDEQERQDKQRGKT